MCNMAIAVQGKGSQTVPSAEGLLVAIELLIAPSYARCKRAKPKPSPGKSLLDFFTSFTWDHCFVQPHSCLELGHIPAHSRGTG